MDNVHVPVLLDEVIAALNIQCDGVYVDGTFGRGGHSRAILARLGSDGRLIAFDKDADAAAAARAIDDARFSMVHGSYAGLAATLRNLGVAQVDGIVLDLGVSSPQLDTGQRGFSFARDGPLDMRMDQSHGETAAEFLARAGENEIAQVIATLGEERYAKRIAKAIAAARSQQPIATTSTLAAIAAQAVPTREPGQHPATRTFQALRIHLNGELDDLVAVLPQCVALLKSLGRLVVISFHSLEDRIVKRFLRDHAKSGSLPIRLAVREAELPQARLRLLGKPVRAAAAEVASNPRARSAIMRAAEKR